LKSDHGACGGIAGPSPLSAEASRESQALPVALAHLEFQGAHFFIQVTSFEVPTTA